MHILVMTTVSGTVNAFLEPHIAALTDEGHSVDIACAVQRPLEHSILTLVNQVHDVPLHRSPLNPRNLAALRALRRLIRIEAYDVIHVHTPVAAFIGRLAAINRRKPIVIYTAHGFHFMHDGPKSAWLLYFPLEWLMSHFTDYLATLNREDYSRARRWFTHPQVAFVPGVGISARPSPSSLTSKQSRGTLGVNSKEVLLLSVGELNSNKGHRLAIEALAQLPQHFKLAIAGEGPEYDALTEMAESFGVMDRVKLLGYRNDVENLIAAADLLIHPSRREGLPVAVMEAMRAATPVIGGRIRGVTDLVDRHSGLLIEGRDPSDWAHAILEVAGQPDKFRGGPTALRPYSVERAVASTLDIYRDISNRLASPVEHDEQP